MIRFRSREIFTDARLTLIALESAVVRHSKTNTDCRLYGNIEPIAVIVCDRHETYALDMQAKLVTFDQLRQKIPELDIIIAPFRKTRN